MGLGGRDLTLGGTQTGLTLRIGAVVSGSTARIRIYQGQLADFSDATLSIPVTAGGAAESYEFVPFSAFVGTVSPSNVDAIALMLDANESGANNIELSLTGANGPKEVNLENTLSTDLAITKTDNRSTAVPGESLTYDLQPEVDLRISKTDNRSSVRIGEVISYTIVVQNAGPSDVQGATVSDVFPAESRQQYGSRHGYGRLQLW